MAPLDRSSLGKVAPSDTGAAAGGLVALVAVAGLGLAIVKIGEEAPPAPPASPVTTATFDPKKLVVVATRHWPFGEGSVERNVRVLTSDPESVRNAANNPSGSLVSGGGDTARAELTDFQVTEETLTAILQVDGLDEGEYAGTVTLNPLIEKAAAQELTVKVHDGFEWPLLVLVLGMLAGVGGTWAYEARRRRDVLRIALVDAGVWLQFVPPSAGVYDLQKELVGPDPNATLFPSAKECARATPSLGVPKLYCAIQGAYTTEKLDDRTKEVETMLARIDRWYRAGQVVNALRVAVAKLDDDLAEVKSESNALAATLAEEPAGADAELTLTMVQAQADVVNVLAETWRLYEAAGSPDGLSPLPIYQAGGAAVDRTPEQSRALVLRLRTLQARLRAAAAFGIPSLDVTRIGAPAWSLGTDQATPTAAEAQIAEPPWASEEAGGYFLSQRIRRSLRIWDLFVFVAHAAVATIAYLLPIWVATQFGSWEQYLGVFAAGFVGKVALDQTLRPMRSTRLAPSAAAPADAAKKGEADAEGESVR
jgi:hypothetical protein